MSVRSKTTQSIAPALLSEVQLESPFARFSFLRCARSEPSVASLKRYLPKEMDGGERSGSDTI